MNRTHHTSFAVVLLALPLAALAAEGAPRPLKGDLVHGRKLYDQHCLSCHGANGVGKDDGVRLTDSGRLNAIPDARLLDILREGDSARPKKKRHFRLPNDVELLEAWDIIGFLRNRTVEVAEMVPEADRYIAAQYTPDEYGLERLKKTLGKDVKADDARMYVFTAYKTGWGGAIQLLPNDPKVLDKLKKNMKAGYVVAVPLEGQDRPTEVVLSLDQKTFAITGARALTLDGSPLPELDKQLARFVGKGDRRVSGQAKAVLKAGGGGKNFAALETAVTESFVRAAECVTAYEVAERDRTWADDEL